VSDRSLRSRLSAPVVVAGSVLVVVAAYLTWLASHLWFYLDDWAFLLHRSVTGPSDKPLLEPHNDHWVTLPILVYRGLFSVFGLRHYLPFGLVNIGLHIAVCVLLAVMLRRVGADPWVCVLAMTLMAFMGPGALDILWDFQMVFLGPAALALAAMVVIDSGEDPPRLPVLAWVLLVLALMCSGAGVVMVVWVSTYAWFRRGFRAAATLAAVPALVYLAWYASYGHGHNTIPTPPAGRILRFLVDGLTNLWDQVLPVPGLGLAVLAVGVLAVTLGRRRLPPRLRMFAGASLVTLAFDFLLLAVTRGGLGLAVAGSTRYLYLGLLLTMPAVGAALQLAWSAMSRHSLVRTGVWIGTALVFVVFGAADFHRVGGMLAETTDGLSARTVAASRMIEGGDPLLSGQVDRVNAPDLDTASLSRPGVRGALPQIVPAPQDVLDAAANLKVAVAKDPFDVHKAAKVTWRGSVDGATYDGGCQTVRAVAGAEVVVAPRPGGAQVRLVVSGDHLVTGLTLGSRHSMGVEWDVVAGEPNYVATTDGTASLTVTVPSGEVSVCRD
jgi:hypothetical protein